MSQHVLKNKRSMSGRHPLLPASRPGIGRTTIEHFPRGPTYSLITWTFGRGSVIWRIWPAVLLHTVFAAAIVTLSLRGIARLEIPTVMLTVLGVVIGFVISYRAMSGYERYWLGRTCWSDIIRNARTLSRLIWFHVPPRLTPKTEDETKSGKLDRSHSELIKVMNEKRMALDLVEGFAVALKHHIRGELGLYYEDLYHLVKPLHDHDHHCDEQQDHIAGTSGPRSPRRPQRIAAEPMPEAAGGTAPQTSAPAKDVTKVVEVRDPVILPINAYGTFDSTTTVVDSSSLLPHHLRSVPSDSSATSEQSQLTPLITSTQPKPKGYFANFSTDWIPFSSVFLWIKTKLSGQQPAAALAPTVATEVENLSRKWRGPIYSRLHFHHKATGEGENLPLEILRCLSEWMSVLEDRTTVAGTSLGAMIAAISVFEDNLTALERILTTPLPFVYSVHIRHTVWLYLFFLPFQLVEQFGYYTIPGVAIAAFIYIGFLAAGEEIEQPFGYDENDLELEMFCREIIHADIEHLKTSPCLNAYLGPQRPAPEHRKSMTLVEVSALEEEFDEYLDEPTS